MFRGKRLRGFDERLQQAIRKSGKTNGQLMREMQIPKTTFYAHICGSQMCPLYLAKYCIALNVSADWLLGINHDG